MTPLQYRGLLPGFAAALAALLLPTVLRAQTEHVFRGDTSVVVVEVPVTVIGHGEAISDLGPENFQILDQGRPQEIESFEVLDAEATAGAPAANGEPPPLGDAERSRRNFLFLFDLAYSDARAIARAAGAVRELVADGLQPSDRVGLAFFSGLRGFQWILPLTDDRHDMAAGLAVLDGLIRSDRGRVRDVLASWAPGDGGRPATARVDPRAILAESGIMPLSRSGDWPHASLFAHLARALEGVAQATAGLDGQRYLVNLSGGIPDRFVTGTTMERARILDLMQGIFRSFRRTGWAVQSVDLNGLGFGRDSLLLLAKETGGQLFTNSNDVDELVREVEARTRVVYMLTFEPDLLEPDGSYHRLEVRLIGAPPGARAIHRPGYYAPDGTPPPAPPSCPTRTCG